MIRTCFYSTRASRIRVRGCISIRFRQRRRCVHHPALFRFASDVANGCLLLERQVEESKQTQSHVDSDRKHYLDAAIVRIMKAKKELGYEQLKTQTIEAVQDHFVPDVSLIKQRITGLMEQEYLKRDEEDMSKYIYIA